MTNIIKKVKNWANASPSPRVRYVESTDAFTGERYRTDIKSGKFEYWNEDEGRWCSLSPSVSPSEEPTASATESDSISPSPSDDPPSPSPSPSPEPTIVMYYKGKRYVSNLQDDRAIFWKCESCSQGNTYSDGVCQYCGAPR